MRNCAFLLLLVVGVGCHHEGRKELTARERGIQESIKSLRIGDVTSYYAFSNPPTQAKAKKLPAIIFLGHPAPEIRPVDHFSLVWGELSEPVVLIWSGLLDGMTEAQLNTPVDDEET